MIGLKVLKGKMTNLKLVILVFSAINLKLNLLSSSSKSNFREK